VTGRLDDGWIPSLGMAPPHEAVVMRERMVDAARHAGRDPAEITCAYNVGISIESTRGTDPTFIAGPPEAIVERLRALVERGVTAFSFMLSGSAADEHAERLAAQVIPALRR
jgi:alkanesulfonate monooxygenase SsuD/methylene tetrahydromethanopterin reductase-like flavin-dependent oxidoreductase (luciferase family)